MKKLKYIVKVLLTIVLCINIMACTDDRINDVPSPQNAKLKKLDYGDDWLQFYYDNQGRISQIENYESDGSLYSISNYEYLGNKIVIRGEYPMNQHIDVCTLKDGLIVKSECSYISTTSDYVSTVVTTYTYDANNRLIRLDENTVGFPESHRVKSLIWKEDNIYKEVGDSYEIIYEYTNIPSSQGITFFDDTFFDFFSDYDQLLWLANFGEYFGKHTKNLISSVRTGDGDASIISYTLNDDGFISVGTQTKNNDIFTLQFSWE